MAYPRNRDAWSANGTAWASDVDWGGITRQRLAWAHGEARAAAIVQGRDQATNTDLAKWRALGCKREAA